MIITASDCSQFGYGLAVITMSLTLVTPEIPPTVRIY
jgi:hypothetical protein